MTWLISLIANVLVGFAKAWLAQQESEKAGELKQAQATETQAQDKVNVAIAASNAVKPLNANSLPNIKPGQDPDFRD